MSRRTLRLGVLAGAAALAPWSSDAIAPAALLLFKQIARQAATSMLKDTLLSGLSGMGCKGIALSNALSAADLRGGGLSALPQLPAGMVMPTLPAGMVMPTLPPGAGLASTSSLPPEVAARLGAMMPDAGQLPPGMALDPAMLARLQQAMSQPLSAPETLATIDELAELGFLPKPLQAELKECMVLVPNAAPALGMGLGMLRPMIPQLREAREQLHALTPAEQDEVAAALAEEMKALPAGERAALLEHLDSGFFPARVSAGAKAALGNR